MPLVIPGHLLEQYQKRQVILFAGAGISIPPMPGWVGLLEDMLAWAPQQGIDLTAEEPELRDLIKGGELLIVAQALSQKMGTHLTRFLRMTFDNPSATPNDRHRLLPGMNFAAILTTNYDKLIESTYSPAPPTYTQLQPDELSLVIKEKQFAVVKLHGDIHRADSLVLCKPDYLQTMYGSPALQDFLTAIFKSFTVLFVGYSLTDPDFMQLLEVLNFHAKGKDYPHYALMNPQAVGKVKIANHLTNQNVQIFGDPDLPKTAHPDIAALFQQLRGPAAPAAPEKQSEPPADLRDLCGLLEIMQHRNIVQHAIDGCLYFTSTHRGKRCLTHYSDHAPELKEFHQIRASKDGSRVDECVLITNRPLPPDIAAKANEFDIKAYTWNGFLDLLADFGPYLDSLRARYNHDEIGRRFIALTVHEKRAGQQVEHPALDDYFESFFQSAGLRHLSLLGNFGTGKSWLCRRMAVRLSALQDRIPVLVQLRGYSPAQNFEDFVEASLKAQGVKLPFKNGFHRLNAEGRLLLIFDGFDEMDHSTPDPGGVKGNFEQIALLKHDRSKIILTCRTEFFRHDAEETDVLEERGHTTVLHSKNDVIEIKDRPDFKVAHLDLFDDAQVEQAICALAQDSGEDLLKKIQASPSIWDLAHRPVLLDMIAKTLPAIPEGEEIDLATLYQRYLADLLDKGTQTIPRAEHLRFLEQLAWDLQSQPEMTLCIPHQAIPARVEAHFQTAATDELTRQICTNSCLIRDVQDNYAFGHRSIQEYLVSSQLAPLLLANQAPQIPMTDAIVSFLFHIASKAAKYEIQEADGMVKVPAGQFVYGNEPERKLTIATIEEDFEIDRYPVTNEDFLTFLNEVKETRQNEFAEWVRHDRSRIKQSASGFEIEAGFERHPVVGISWHAATAYAEHVKKRLPTEQEWEKAARGIDGRHYPWGEEFDPKKCNTLEGEQATTTEVEKYDKGRSPYGANDMAGNVWDWTASPWESGGKSTVVRGGSWDSHLHDAACAARYNYPPDDRSSDIGFRCSRTKT